MVPGTVIIKLVPQAAIQAFEAQAGADDIVQSGVESLDQRFQELGITDLEPLAADVVDATGQNVQTFAAQNRDVGQLYVASFPPDVDPNAVADSLSQDPNVEYVEPNYIAGIVGGPSHIPLKLDPNDQFFNFQWNMQSIQMQPAWDAATGQNIIVAIVDTMLIQRMTRATALTWPGLWPKALTTLSASPASLLTPNCYRSRCLTRPGMGAMKISFRA
jgi:hypothetical protein